MLGSCFTHPSRSKRETNLIWLQVEEHAKTLFFGLHCYWEHQNNRAWVQYFKEEWSNLIPIIFTDFRVNKFVISMKTDANVSRVGDRRLQLALMPLKVVLVCSHSLPEIYGAESISKASSRSVMWTIEPPLIIDLAVLHQYCSWWWLVPLYQARQATLSMFHKGNCSTDVAFEAIFIRCFWWGVSDSDSQFEELQRTFLHTYRKLC